MQPHAKSDSTTMNLHDIHCVLVSVVSVLCSVSRSDSLSSPSSTSRAAITSLVPFFGVGWREEMGASVLVCRVRSVRNSSARPSHRPRHALADAFVAELRGFHDLQGATLFKGQGSNTRQSNLRLPCIPDLKRMNAGEIGGETKRRSAIASAGRKVERRGLRRLACVLRSGALPRSSQPGLVELR